MGLRTVDRSQVLWGWDELSLLAPLKNLTTRSCLPTDWQAMRAWFIAIDITYTLSMEGVHPLSSSSCKTSHRPFEDIDASCRWRSRLRGRFWGPEKLPSSRGSWYTNLAPGWTRRQYAGLPLHRAPNLEASVITTFLLEVSSNRTPGWYRRGAFLGATALTQQWLTLRRKCPWCQSWDGMWV